MVSFSTTLSDLPTALFQKVTCDSTVCCAVENIVIDCWFVLRHLNHQRPPSSRLLQLYRSAVSSADNCRSHVTDNQPGTTQLCQLRFPVSGRWVPFNYLGTGTSWNLAQEVHHITNLVLSTCYIVYSNYKAFLDFIM